MADTIITNTPGRRETEEGAGWIVAMILIIAIVFGGIMLYRDGFFGTNAPAESTNINVSIPDTLTPSNNGTDGGGINTTPSTQQ